MDFERLQSFLAERGEPAFRLAQAKRAFFVDMAEGWDGVTVFAKPLREALAAQIPWNLLTPIRTQEAPHGDTVKTLFACADGQKIEGVLMRHEDGRNTVCVSSQAGCPMACAFCATGTMGLKRNLSAAEIVEQVAFYARWLKPKKERVTNVVLMGMGEPFHNYDNVMKALRLLNDKDGLNIGARHLSISTCGVVPGILKLADEQFQCNLAISLHAGTDEVRNKIMPVNKAYPLAKLMEAVHTYMEKTNRQVMFEYLLLKGINDRPEDAAAVAKLLGPDYRLVHVNVIKYHPTEAFDATERDARVAFVRMLHEHGVPATHRITFGEDIDAACGQLAVREEQGQILQGLKAVRSAKQGKVVRNEVA
ncbi:MAG TPA: 23S rRNA (adenine(2503)-C(2))-methyltransferase RlmN [Verrucomicrobiae bacterium]|nr:23S rRNA (adenine(2503)-C(2))-methyltransferase RlmN [Verrucomicrobiae bacterium]